MTNKPGSENTTRTARERAEEAAEKAYPEDPSKSKHLTEWIRPVFAEGYLARDAEQSAQVEAALSIEPTNVPLGSYDQHGVGYDEALRDVRRAIEEAEG